MAMTFMAMQLPACDDDDESDPTRPDPPVETPCAPGSSADERGECVSAGLPPDAPCAPGEVSTAAGCEPAGLPTDMPCAPGERETPTGCRPAGMAPDACGDGFLHDEDRSCEPILPSAPCAAGLMAIPGDAACREVSPCGSGPWGDIATDTGTQHVDAAYVGGDADGTAAKPWPTLQEGIDAAPVDGLVAVAAGVYAEDVTIDKPVRVEGRCPSMVSIEGQAASAAVTFGSGSSGGTLVGIAVTGPQQGVLVGSADVLLERLWGRDANRAVLALPGASVTVSSSLFEEQGPVSLEADSAALTLVSSVIRGTRTYGGADPSAILAHDDAELVLERSVVEGSEDVGVRVDGGSATIDGCVIRTNTGRGLRSRGGAALSITDTLVEGNGSASVDSGLDLGTGQTNLERVLLRGNRGFGGLTAFPTEGDAPSQVTIVDSVVEANELSGVWIHESEVEAEGLLIRDQVERADGNTFAGLNALRSTVSLLGSSLERNRFAGLFVQGGTLTLEDTRVLDTALENPSSIGAGVVVTSDDDEPSEPVVILRRAQVQDNRGAGVVLGSVDAMIERSVIADTQLDGRPETLEGTTGLLVGTNPDAPVPSHVVVVGSRVERTAVAGVTVVGSTLELVDSAILESGVADESRFGSGLLAHEDDVTRAAADVELSNSLVEGSSGAGIAGIGGVEVRLSGSVVRGTRIEADGTGGHGIFLARGSQSRTDANVALTWSIVEDNFVAGVQLAGANVTVDRSVIRGTSADASNLYGDGISVATGPGNTASSASIVSSIVEGSARAALAVFGSTLEYGGTALGCQAFDLVGEVVLGRQFVVRPLGRSACGCPDAADDCLLESPGLSPPAPPGVPGG